jgi:prephenate dehydrogenase
VTNDVSESFHTNDSSVRTLGLIGYGAFGRFIAPHLAEHFQVVAYDPCEAPSPRSPAIRIGTLRQAADCDIVVLGPPVQLLEEVIREVAPMLRAGTLVADVASVKVRPVALMQSLLPANVDIVGLHPLFGPQSGRNGIRGLPIVVCPVRPASADGVVKFLAERMELAVSVQTADEHDRAMARVQALTHFVAAALGRVGLPETDIATPSYAHLRTFVDMVRFDAPALYQAIQCENPYARGVREELMKAVRQLGEELECS